MADRTWQSEALLGALKMVGAAEPKDLVRRAHIEAEERGTSLTSDEVTEILREAENIDPFLFNLGMQVHKWDAALSSEEWTQGTSPSSSERRSLICFKLGLTPEGAQVLLEKRPIYHDATIVITADWERWYSPQRAAEHEFYWPSYRDYLLTVKRWDDDVVTSLDLASTQVLERLANPTRREAYQSKGLVVGFVQSGKTANITGVIAKAIDAGYRLIIVMTGTIEMLRAQTQRRIDMELVGRQNIIGDLSPEQAREARIDYQDDEDWRADRFADLGSDELVSEIQRLTTHRLDYQKQFKTLKIDRFDMSLGLFEPENLYRTPARLVITKKNSNVLRKLVTDIRANKRAFLEIPVLIVDDESDLASVNTVNPEVVRAARQEGKEVQERRAINERIAEMLELMQRSQYVGYTATPFANVFADPSDPMGIFPKDFVIGLQRPKDYMGVEDFHDLNHELDQPKTLETSNERAFVRNLLATDDDQLAQEEELATAIDMFVLTGAVKLYRQQVDPGLDFRHHTMLVHQSVKTGHQRDLAETIKDLWSGAHFSSPQGKARLKALYESDIRPVSEVRREAGVPPSPEFEELSPCIAKTITKVTEHGLNPVIVVNSDTDVQKQQQALDFDRYGTWRILVGGAKLSRGFTVEGLTVTYFRRATQMSDSLTQMGRWFGFRKGYKDLVRLFIARQAKFNRKEVDLYEAFESVALDETAFRDQLAKYSEWDHDKPRVLPREIPPLVSQHLPWLRPTARNKMFNARLVEQSEQPFTPSGYANHVDLLKSSMEAWRPTFAAASREVFLPSGGGGSFRAFIGTVSASGLVISIDTTHYLGYYKEWTVDPQITFYRRLIEEGQLEDFLLIVPQPETNPVEVIDVGKRTHISRDRRHGRGGKFGEMTEPKNRGIVLQFVEGDVGGGALEPYLAPNRGAVLLYVAKETRPEYEMMPPPKLPQADPEFGLIPAFSVYIPGKALPRERNVIRFVVRDPDQEDSPIIEAANHGE
jgi:hypothetical protein